MKAQDLVARLSALVAEHGNLEVLFDCDFVMTEVGSVDLLEDKQFDSNPVIVIYPPATPATV